MNDAGVLAKPSYPGIFGIDAFKEGTELRQIFCADRCDPGQVKPGIGGGPLCGLSNLLCEYHLLFIIFYLLSCIEPARVEVPQRKLECRANFDASFEWD